MPVKAVIGGQWGDEGKGKIVDFLAGDADIVVRFAGGGNAGHSVENENGKFVLRTIPVGMVNSHTKLNIIARGTAPELNIVVGELKALVRRGINICRLRIDESAHLVMPWHIFEDKLEEELLGNKQIGTTKNGIGPCYADKARRTTAFRVGDLLDFRLFKKRYWEILNRKMEYFQNCFDHFQDTSHICDDCRPMLEPEETLKEIERNIAYLRRKFGGLKNLICDTRPILRDALDEGQNILLEGAQGYFLDINHGTWPYVTSSGTGVASAVDVCGLSVFAITESVAVIKAYTTRVGEGPFPTEMSEAYAKKIRDIAHEYGTVTGRPRRCGWFDTVYFKEMARQNGLTGVAITRLDILDDFPYIGIGVDDPSTGSGQVGGRIIEWMSGWRIWTDSGFSDVSVRNCRTWDSLPQAAKDYCLRIACGVPIKYISVGPAREETIVI